MRLPALSTLSVQEDSDQLVLTERLKGQDLTAAVALTAAAVTLGLLAGPLLSAEYRQHVPGAQINFITAYAAVEIGVMVALIQQTWRKTVLAVRFDEIVLKFTSPFHRVAYRWRGDEILDVVVAETANQRTWDALAEMVITRIGGGDVHLFTDHRLDHVTPLAGRVMTVLRGGETASEVRL